MQKRSLRTLLFSSALLVSTVPGSAWAEDLTPQPTAKIQVTMVNGRFVVTNAAPNPPITLPEPVPAVPGRSLDSRMPAEYQPLVHTISKAHGVDPHLVAAVMKVESNYDRWARSSKNARGLMQLIPATGKRFGVSDFYSPRENIEGGVKYLKFLSDKFGSNLDLILAAYNAGENLVERVQRIPAIKETQDYVRKIRAIYRPSGSPAPVSSPALARVGDSKPALVEAAPAAPNRIYWTVDERGTMHVSNVGPPN